MDMISGEAMGRMNGRTLAGAMAVRGWDEVSRGRAGLNQSFSKPEGDGLRELARPVVDLGTSS